MKNLDHMERQAPASAESWREQLDGAIAEVFPAEDAEIVAEGSGIGALSAALQVRCRATGATPCDVLRQLSANDVQLAPRVDTPGYFLAYRVERLTALEGDGTGECGICGAEIYAAAELRGPCDSHANP